MSREPYWFLGPSCTLYWFSSLSLICISFHKLMTYAVQNQGYERFCLLICILFSFIIVTAEGLETCWIRLDQDFHVDRVDFSCLHLWLRKIYLNVCFKEGR